MLIATVLVPVAPDGTLTRPSDEPSGQLAPSFQERSIQISLPGAPLAMVAHAMPLEPTCREISRPSSVVPGTGESPDAPAELVPSHCAAHTCGWTQLVQTTPLASPQARTRARAWFAGSYMLYIRVRVPVQPLGIAAFPSSPSQVVPPSQERSIHTASLSRPLSMLAQAMPSASSTCSSMTSRFSYTLGVGKVSDCACDGLRVSQSSAHTVVAAAARDGAVPRTGTSARARTVSAMRTAWALRRPGERLTTL